MECEEICQRWRCLQSAVLVIALILYRNNRIRTKVNQKLKTLNLDNILDSFNAEGRIKVECVMPALVLDVDTAISIGLIANELITNSLKYAFNEKEKGEIKISLNEQNVAGELLLKIADIGIGKPLNGKAKGTGFGTQLINLLTRQLHGQLHYEVNNGTTVSLLFNKAKVV